MTMDTLEIRASQVLDNIMCDHHAQYGAGSMTTTIYDTAWVSMISKEVDRNTEWLFPKSFLYLLETQRSSGGWDTYASEIDCILNTAAALLSLFKHHENPYELGGTVVDDLPSRIQKGSSFLNTALRNWDLSSTRHVGFEILVPSLLEMLECHGIYFDFDCRGRLLEIRDQKLARFNTRLFYGDKKTSALHSLEGYAGKIDFDKVGHHKVAGSIMGSPAATSAYLIYSTRWDMECESYIRHVIQAGSGKGDGSVPSAYPSHLFELSWTISTLLDSGYDKSDLGPSLGIAQGILEHSFDVGSNMIGFAPFFEPDADDTAKGIISLRLLGKEVSTDDLVRHFEQEEWFKTYQQERNPSFTTNCNVLRALVCRPISSHINALQIGKILRFLCKSWLNNTNVTRDKWNLSVEYSTMLLAEALMGSVNLWDGGFLSTVTLKFMREEVILVLFQVLFRTLEHQEEDGSWGNSAEITAYAVLTINAVMCLPLFHGLKDQIYSALSIARRYLRQCLSRSLQANYLWIEKVTYGSRTLSAAYVLAALKCSPALYRNSEDMSILFEGMLAETSKPVKFFQNLPMFASTPRWWLQGSMIEGMLYSEALKKKANEIFGRQISSKAKHLVFIPFTWTSGNNLAGAPLGSETLLEMMVAAALAYDIDEIMEGEVASLSVHDRESVQNAILDMCADQKLHRANGDLTHTVKLNSSLNGNWTFSKHNPASDMEIDRDSASSGDKKVSNETGKVGQIIGTFRHFIDYYLKHSRVRKASLYDQAILRIEIYDFLKAHLTQIKDNSCLRAQSLPSGVDGGYKTFQSASGSFYSWIRSTSGNHTAGPFAFALFKCLLGPGDGSDSLNSVEANYCVEDLSRHLAALCRLYNDYGSVARDRTEDNLNSIQFPEFTKFGNPRMETDEVLKERLFNIAEYERRCLEQSLIELQKLVSAEIFSAIKVFCSTADMYGQMYVQKDLTPSIKRHSDAAHL